LPTDPDGNPVTPTDPDGNPAVPPASNRNIIYVYDVTNTPHTLVRRWTTPINAHADLFAYAMWSLRGADGTAHDYMTAGSFVGYTNAGLVGNVLTIHVSTDPITGGSSLVNLTVTNATVIREDGTIILPTSTIVAGVAETTVSIPQGETITIVSREGQRITGWSIAHKTNPSTSSQVDITSSIIETIPNHEFTFTVPTTPGYSAVNIMADWELIPTLDGNLVFINSETGGEVYRRPLNLNQGTLVWFVPTSPIVNGTPWNFLALDVPNSSGILPNSASRTVVFDTTATSFEIYVVVIPPAIASVAELSTILAQTITTIAIPEHLRDYILNTIYGIVSEAPDYVEVETDEVETDEIETDEEYEYDYVYDNNNDYTYDYDYNYEDVNSEETYEVDEEYTAYEETQEIEISDLGSVDPTAFLVSPLMGTLLNLEINTEIELAPALLYEILFALQNSGSSEAFEIVSLLEEALLADVEGFSYTDGEYGLILNIYSTEEIEEEIEEITYTAEMIAASAVYTVPIVIIDLDGNEIGTIYLEHNSVDTTIPLREFERDIVNFVNDRNLENFNLTFSIENGIIIEVDGEKFVLELYLVGISGGLLDGFEARITLANGISSPADWEDTLAIEARLAPITQLPTQFNITVNNVAAGTVNPTNSVAGVTVTLAHGTAPANHTFGGWTITSALGTQTISGSTFTMPAADVTATAIWTPTTGGGNNNPPGGGNNNPPGGGNNNPPGGGWTQGPSQPESNAPSGTWTQGHPVIRETDLVPPITPAPIGEIMLGAITRLGYIQGFTNGAFRPEAFLTRAEMAQIMFNLSDDPARFGQAFFGFDDVYEDGWYFEAISYFANAGILIGFGDGTFRPNDYITMAQFAQFMYGVFGLGARDLNNPMQGRVGHWSNRVVAAAFDAQFTAYPGGNFSFSEDVAITRAQAVTFINQYMGYLPVVADIDAYLEANEIDGVFTDVERGHWAFYQIFLASGDFN